MARSAKSGDRREGSRFLLPLASCTAGCCGCGVGTSAIACSRSCISPSKPPIALFSSLRRGGSTDDGGLERELALLCGEWLESLEDCETEGVWKGFCAPNSASRFIPAALSFRASGGPRGGGGGVIEGWRACGSRGGEVRTKVGPSKVVEATVDVEGWRGRADSDGRRGRPTKLLPPGAALGKVLLLFAGVRGGGASSDEEGGGPNPP